MPCGAVLFCPSPRCLPVSYIAARCQVSYQVPGTRYEVPHITIKKAQITHNSAQLSSAQLSSAVWCGDLPCCAFFFAPTRQHINEVQVPRRIARKAHPAQLSSAQLAQQRYAVRCCALSFVCMYVHACMQRPGCCPGAWSSWHFCKLPV